MINTQYINLNMTPSGVMPVLYVSQYDIGRPLGMVVYNGGEAVDLDTYTCTIEATRTDGTAVTTAVTTDDNIGAFVTTATMTNKADRYPAKLVLFDSNSRRVASLAFIMCVTPATMDENAESIEEDRSLYQQYTEAVQAALADIRNTINNLDFVTPEMYGAVGDGTTDDYTALSAALQTGKDVRGNDCTYYCSQTIESQDCAHVEGLRVTLAPMAFIGFHADHFLMENCEFDHGSDFLNITDRGEFLVACYGKNVEVANTYFHDTVSALFCGFEQDYVVVRGCHFKNCKESLDALTRGVNGYGVVTDAAKNLNVSDCLFEDVYRHSVYISMSDITTQTPTSKATIANNIIRASDKNADRQVTGFEVPIMCRNAEDVEVCGNVFDDMFGGCFTFGGEYESGYTHLNFHDNTVIGGYASSEREQYGAINMLATANDGNIAWIHDNEFRNCTYVIVNADKCYGLKLNDNIIDTTKGIIYSGYTNRDDTAGTIEARRNRTYNARALIYMFQTASEITIAENDFDESNNFVYSNSGGKTSNALLRICDNHASKYLNVNVGGMQNIAIYRNVAEQASTIAVDQSASLVYYGNLNLNLIGQNAFPCDTIIATGATGTSIHDLLKNTFSGWINANVLSDTTYTVSITGYGAGVNKQYSGFINVVNPYVRFLITDSTNTYSGTYNHTAGSIVLHGVSTNQMIPTSANSVKTITFDTNGYHMAIIAERFNSVTLVYFSGEAVYTLPIAGTAHSCAVVNDHAFSFTCQYSSWALITADTFFSVS